LSARGSAALVVAAVAASCTSSAAPEPEARASGSHPSIVAPSEGSPPGAAEQAAPPATADAPLSAITDVVALSALEAQGFSFAERISGGAAAADASLAALAATTEFGAVADLLTSDLAELAAGDPRAGVGMRFAHRLFDPDWLRSPSTRLELVGVLSRLDRRPFVAGACGEIRLVYRLAYTTEVGGRSLSSRLPMTLALDYLGDPPREDGCREVAARWRGARDVPWLRAEELEPERLHRLLVNLQSVRWPSAVHPSLGGHAEYVLRSFRRGEQASLVVEPLENTPDVVALRRDDAARAELLAWIRDPETLRRLDEGVAVMPARFAAERAVSAAPRGLARLANRPFAQLYAEADFEDLDFTDLARVRSAAGLLRRLDDHSCAGCHQGRALAGFHLLGEDGPGTASGNAIAAPFSPHARDELERRRELLAAEIAGEVASYTRPFSERDRHGAGGYGSPCGLTTDPTFAVWDCAEGLVCRPYDASPEAPHVGGCLPAKPQVGDPCEVGTLRSRADPRADRASRPEAWSCPEGAVCNANRVGFPGGMCTASCADPGEQGRCGAIAVLEPFNACIARGAPFDACLRDHVRPAGLRACDAERPCRHDYLCADAGGGEGVCIPPYFLFQMRVDGHP
jgi:hypothetical protein